MRVVPTIKLFDCLIVPIQIELNDSTVEKIQNQILNEIEKLGINTLIIDVSTIDVIDSYISYMLLETANMVKMMGCDTFICGIQPQVALTLAQMGIDLKGINFAQDLEGAFKLIKRMKGNSYEGEGILSRD